MTRTSLLAWFEWWISELHGKAYWHLRAPNGEIVANDGPFADGPAALEAIATFRRVVAEPANAVIFRGIHGGWFWHVEHGATGEIGGAPGRKIAGRGEGHSRQGDAQRALDTARSLAIKAPVHRIHDPAVHWPRGQHDA